MLACPSWLLGVTFHGLAHRDRCCLRPCRCAIAGVNKKGMGQALPVRFTTLK